MFPHMKGIWQTDRRNVRVSCKVNKTIQLDDSNIIVQIARVKLRMYVDAQRFKLNIWVKLAVIVYIPLA